MGIVTVVASSSTSWWQTALVGFGSAFVGAFVGALGAVVGSFMVNRHERTQQRRLRSLTELFKPLVVQLHQALELKGDCQRINTDSLRDACRDMWLQAMAAGRRDSRRFELWVWNPIVVDLGNAEHYLQKLTSQERTSDDPEVKQLIEKRDKALTSADISLTTYGAWLAARFGTHGSLSDRFRGL